MACCYYMSTEGTVFCCDAVGLSFVVWVLETSANNKASPLFIVVSYGSNLFDLHPYFPWFWLQRLFLGSCILCSQELHWAFLDASTMLYNTIGRKKRTGSESTGSCTSKVEASLSYVNKLLFLTMYLHSDPWGLYSLHSIARLLVRDLHEQHNVYPMLNSTNSLSMFFV